MARPDGRLRVLHIITRLDRGGSSENTLLTVTGLDRERYVVALASGPSSGEPGRTQIRAQRLEVSFLRVPHLCRDIRPVADLRALVELWHLIRRGKYDIVHTHTSKAGILGRVAARLARVPVVIHTPHGHVFHGYYGYLISQLFVQIERWAASFTDRIITLTAKGARDHVDYGVASEEKFSVIHSGVEFATLRKVSASSNNSRVLRAVGNGEIVFGTVGRLEPVKAHSVLIAAFAKVAEHADNVRLLLVGDGELREDLQQQTRELNVASKVIFAGWCADVGEPLSRMDIFVLPSHNEGMGKALVEAMYIGLPCIASNVGGIPEVLEHDKHGVLVPPGSPDDLAREMITLANDPDKRRRLGVAASEQARIFSDQVMVAKIEDLYDELAAEARR